jgi:hypothetical protein
MSLGGQGATHRVALRWCLLAELLDEAVKPARFEEATRRAGVEVSSVLAPPPQQLGPVDIADGPSFAAGEQSFTDEIVAEAVPNMADLVPSDVVDVLVSFADSSNSWVRRIVFSVGARRWKRRSTRLERVGVASGSRQTAFVYHSRLSLG